MSEKVPEFKEDGDYENLGFLKVVEILNDDRIGKVVTILAKDDKGQKAVIHCNKTPFPSDLCQDLISKCQLKIDLKNDCYHTLGMLENLRRGRPI
jgi:hypothetical protein